MLVASQESEVYHARTAQNTRFHPRFIFGSQVGGRSPLLLRNFFLETIYLLSPLSKEKVLLPKS
jgi:hypothetical protein